MLSRRLFASGLLAALAAPAIIRLGVLMPVKRLVVGDGIALHSAPHPGWPGPIGEMRPFLGDPPPGWLPLDGRAVDRRTYAELFAVSGTLWGEGNGSTTFNIPDMRGAVIGGSGPLTDPLRYLIRATA